MKKRLILLGLFFFTLVTCFFIGGCPGSPLNALSMVYYGKVIDQYGQPVPGVRITGDVILGSTGDELNSAITQAIETQTDANGLFHFISFHRIEKRFELKKSGYKYGYIPDPTLIPMTTASAYTAPNKENKTSFLARGVFIMWKQQSPERLYPLHIRATIPADGTPAYFDLINSTRVVQGGDLALAFALTPAQIERNKPFSWNFVVEAARGGLIEIKEPYPFTAPSSGYQTKITASNSSDISRDGIFIFEKSFYYQAAGGKYYGRINIMLHLGRNSLLDATIDAYINNSGSRNLEYDPKVQPPPSGNRGGFGNAMRAPPPPVPQ